MLEITIFDLAIVKSVQGSEKIDEITLAKMIQTFGTFETAEKIKSDNTFLLDLSFAEEVVLK